MTKRSMLPFAAIAAGAMLIAGGLWVSSAPQSGMTLAAVAQEARAVGEAAALPDMVMGQQDAPVTIIEYASYTCSHCANFHETVLAPLKAEYIDTGKVKFIHREVYFDKFGLWAGMIANCVGPEKYYPVSGMIYDTQADWIGDGKEATISANLRKIGLKAGLTGDQVEACLNDMDRAQAMVASYQQKAGADGIDATPTLIINGTKHSNMGYDALKKIIDAELAK